MPIVAVYKHGDSLDRENKVWLASYVRRVFPKPKPELVKFATKRNFGLVLS